MTLVATNKTLIRKVRKNYTVYTVPSQNIRDEGEGTIIRTATSSVTYGANKKNWRELIKTGGNATTGLSGVRYSVGKWSPATLQLQMNSGNSYYMSGYPNAGTIVPGFPDTQYTVSAIALSKAETNFAKSYRKATQQATLGVTLGELTEAARLLANPVKSLYGLTRRLADDLKKAKHLYKPLRDGGQDARLTRRRKQTPYHRALSEAWLAYQFGARPLVSEADGFATAIRAIDSGRTYDLIRLFGEGSHETDEGTQIGYSCASQLNNLTAEVELRTVLHSSVRIRGAIRVQGEIPPMQRLGLSTLDIVPTAWELIPFSFLLDYFSNAGDTLDALMLRFVDFAWLNQTVRNRRTATYSSLRPYKLDARWERSRSAYGGSARFSTTTINRDVRGNDFGGRLVFTAPGLGSLKWLNIAALSSAISQSRPR